MDQRTSLIRSEICALIRCQNLAPIFSTADIPVPGTVTSSRSQCTLPRKTVGDPIIMHCYPSHSHLLGKKHLKEKIPLQEGFSRDEDSVPVRPSIINSTAPLGKAQKAWETWRETVNPQAAPWSHTDPSCKLFNNMWLSGISSKDSSSMVYHTTGGCILQATVKAPAGLLPRPSSLRSKLQAHCLAPPLQSSGSCITSRP